MLFNSLEFIFIFLPAALFLFWRFKKQQQILLILLSLVFYAYWDYRNLPLLLASIVFNLIFGNFLLRNPQKRFLIIGIACNLLPLIFFKYFHFLQILLIEQRFDTVKHEPAIPLAISFFTFQQIAYLSDVYLRKIHPGSVTSYFLFVSFFPQLISGPIVHYKEMMPQFKRIAQRNFKYFFLSKGLYLFTIGLFKKTVIADSVFYTVNKGYTLDYHMDFFVSWIISISYSMQIYFDFSGYTDMALGAALCFGIKLPQNFNSPYKAVNLQDFWRRWHMTLSRWLRNYVYIPLGGGKTILPLVMLNVFVTFLIGGVWHGSGWLYLLWGALHGAGLCVFLIFRKLKLSIPVFLAQFITFVYVVIAFVPFRAPDHGKMVVIYNGMLGRNGIFSERFLASTSSSGLPLISDYIAHLTNKFQFNSFWIMALYIGVPLLITFALPNSTWFVKHLRFRKRELAAAVFMLVTSLFFINRTSPFLYFQF